MNKKGDKIMKVSNSHYDCCGDYRSNDGIFETYFGSVDEHNNPVRRTKQSHPYNYDGFILWRFGKNEEATSTIYSDRLLQWD